MTVQLAVHIRDAGQLGLLGGIPDDLGRFYDPAGEGACPWPTDVDAVCTRVYAGDEFCAARMPPLPALQRLAEAARRRGLSLSLLTPVMTDEDLDNAAPLFRYLEKNHPGTEVVCNDWGVMAHLAGHCPGLSLAAGRLLDRGFKDPRRKGPSAAPEEDESPADPLLNRSTFDAPLVRGRLSAMGIRRLEQDLLPYQTDAAVHRDGLERSVYFPLGYVTSGRICWTANWDSPPHRRFTLRGRCSRPCDATVTELEDESFAFRLFQSGNTVFYLYPTHRLARLLAEAARNGERLVYQGFGVASP